MSTVRADNIFGFYASFQMGDMNKELVIQFLWGETGLKEQLKNLKWQTYGQDVQLILFEFYVNPIPLTRDALKEIGNCRPKEKSIGIPVILDHENFFRLTQIERLRFFQTTVYYKIDLLKVKVKRNKLDLDIDKLRADVVRILHVE